MADPKTTRGFLNNNPGNIDRSPAYTWNGEVRDVNDPRLTEFQKKELKKGRFCVFLTPQYGVRAIVLNLQAYQRNGIRSIEGMIKRWAPPNENNTQAYIDRVVRATNYMPDHPVDMKEYKVALEMAKAITEVECGGNPYDNETFDQGLQLAGVIKPVTLKTSKTAQGGTAAIGGISAASAAEVVQSTADTIAPLAATNTTFMTVLAVLKVVGAVLVVGGVAWMLYARFARHRSDEVLEAVDDHDMPGDPIPAGVGKK